VASKRARVCGPSLILPARSRSPSPPLAYTSSPYFQSAITALSDNFDMDAYNDAVKVFPAFKMIF